MKTLSSIVEYQGCKTVNGSSGSLQITGQSNSLNPGTFVGAWVTATAGCSFTVWDSNVSTALTSTGLVKLWSYVGSSLGSQSYVPAVPQRVLKGLFVNASGTTDWGVCFL